MTSTTLRLVTSAPAGKHAAVEQAESPRSSVSRANVARQRPVARAVRRPIDADTPYRLWRPADPGVELTVVVPFYNPGSALRPTVLNLVQHLRAARVGFEVVAVSDGSTDGSEHTLDGIGPEVRVLVSERNVGKGGALHLGFSRARGAWVGFVDADGDIDPAHVVEYLTLARDGGHAVVYADKRHADSSSGATGFRKLVSMVYSTLVSVLFMLGVRHTQTGCKVFRRDILARLLPGLRERRFAFDLEFFVAAKAAGVRDLLGAPVRLETRTAGSTVGSRTILRTIRDTFVIFGRLRLARHYHVRTAPVIGLGSTVEPAGTGVASGMPAGVSAA
jgi:glycosyltransferase involved in cell wall biosynthesis